MALNGYSEEFEGLMYQSIASLTIPRAIFLMGEFSTSQGKKKLTLHYITLHYITLHYITLHYITLHYITLHYITLHYITLHPYVYTG